MTLNRKQRRVIAIAATPVIWFILWATAGYFAGIRGVEPGWPSFWVVGGIALSVLVVSSSLGGLIMLATIWVNRGEK